MLSYLITFSTIMAFSFLVSFFKISTMFFFFIYICKRKKQYKFIFVSQKPFLHVC